MDGHLNEAETHKLIIAEMNNQKYGKRNNLVEKHFEKQNIA